MQDVPDGLAAVDPKEFVAARDALVRERRAAGDKEGAAAIKALRRPSVPDWALARVRQEQPEVVARFVAAAADADTAQEQVLQGGDREQLRDALARRRAAMGVVAGAMRSIIAASERDPATYERPIEDALETLANGGEDVVARLAATVDVDAPPRAAARPAPRRAEVERLQRAAADAAARVEAAELVVREAQAALDARRQEARDAAAALDAISQ